MDGFVNVLKPTGMTSHDVVTWARKLFGQRKIGHTGTLDPGATGVLVLSLGRATRLSEYVLELSKSYRCEMVLGRTTDTGDAFGKVVEQKSVPEFSQEQLEEVFRKFKGNIKQVPPMTSAVKVGGKKLYQLAREGKTVARKERLVKIYSLDIVRVDKEAGITSITFDVSCAKGTYIRTLCHDIGQELGCGAFMKFLLRTKVGPFEIGAAFTLEELERCKGEPEQFLLPMDTAVSHWSKVKLTSEYFRRKLCNGNLIQSGGFVMDADHSQSEVRIYDHNDCFIAIGYVQTTPAGMQLKANKVFCHG